MITSSSSEAALEFREFNPTTELSLRLELFQDAFPEVRGTITESPEFYRWKFHSFPDTRTSYEYGAYQNGKLVGYYAAIPFPYVFQGKSARVAMVCDVMTHSSMRGKGIFTKLGRYAVAQLEKEGLSVSTGYPIRPEVIPGHLKVGWNIAFELPTYIAPISSRGILASKNLGFLSPVADLGIAVVHRVLKLLSTEAKGISVRKEGIETFLSNPAYPIFLEKWKSQRKSYLVKSPEFLEWRFGAPGSTYEVISTWKDGDIVALAFVRVTELKGIKTLAVLDLMGMPDPRAGSDMLLQALVSHAKHKGADLMALMASRTTAKKYGLLRNGFLRAPFVFKLIVRSLADGQAAAEYFPETDHDLGWIDSDDL